MTAIVLVGGSAGAVIARRWTGFPRGFSAAPSVARVAIPAKTTPTKKMGTSRVPAAESVPETPAVDDSPRPSVAPSAGIAKANVGRATRSAAGGTRAPTVLLPSAATPTRSLANQSVAEAAVARERSEVLDAMIALRRHRDPDQAGVLLDRYLAAHPHGALHEEALALAIEAADARHDRTSARTFARVYQLKYPKGRFLSFALSHVDESAP